MKKILLATDFSKASEKVIHYAVTLFDDTACEFTLLYSYGMLALQGMDTSMIDNVRGLALQSMQEFLTRLKVYDNLKYHKFKFEVLATSPSSSIELLHQKNQYDLVVVGTSGLADNDIFGSEATDIIRNVPTNTLVVPYHVTIKPTKNIVLALDYHRVRNYEIFDCVKDLTKRKEANLTLLTILDEAAKPQTLNKLEVFEYHNYFKDTITTDYYIKNNAPEEGINEYLENHVVDMLVMVSRHHTFFDVLFDRSTTRHIALHAAVPLLSIYEKVDEIQLSISEQTTF